MLNPLFYLFHPGYTWHRFRLKFSDRYYIEQQWKTCMSYPLDLDNPRTFNEKLQWLKLHDQNPLYTTLVDKYRVKQWVADKIGEQYVIPTLAVYDSADEIELNNLPDRFVFKCNHDSGSVVICRDKSSFDLEAAKQKLGEAMKRNYYELAREWPYKNVKPCIFAEKLLGESKEETLDDYKLMVFNGKVKCSFVCTNRGSNKGLHVTFYDREWKKMPFERKYPAEDGEVERPSSYDLMVQLSELLCENIRFSRVDFYEIDGAPVFGEITLFPGAGYEPFSPEEWDAVLGSWLELHI